MKTSAKKFISLSSFGLLLAVALAPALLQETCEVELPDPTVLANLEFRPFQMGSELPHDVMTFESGVTEYAVVLPTSSTEAMIVAEPAVESSTVSVQCIAGGTIDGHICDPDLDWTMIALPEGNSIVQVVVRASPELGSGTGMYTINVTREQPDPTVLVNLEFRPFQMGHELPYDVMTFQRGVMEYAVEIPESVHEAMVVAEPAVESSTRTIQCIAGGTIDGHAFDPDLTWTMIDVPEGNSIVQVFVRASLEQGSALGMYTIHITRAPGTS
jgi:hypothetical protein